MGRVRQADCTVPELGAQAGKADVGDDGGVQHRARMQDGGQRRGPRGGGERREARLLERRHIRTGGGDAGLPPVMAGDKRASWRLNG